MSAVDVRTVANKEIREARAQQHKKKPAVVYAAVRRVAAAAMKDGYTSAGEAEALRDFISKVADLTVGCRQALRLALELPRYIPGTRRRDVSNILPLTDPDPMLSPAQFVPTAHHKKLRHGVPMGLKQTTPGVGAHAKPFRAKQH